MTFKKGDAVLIKKFKRNGLILEVLQNGGYKVSLGGLPITLSEDDISQADEDSQPNKSTRKENAFTVQSSISQGSEKEALDLHGLTVQDALVALEAKLNRAVLSNLHRIKVIHGHGTGRVKEGVHKYLSTCSMIHEFKPDEFNAGITWIYL